MSNELRWGEWKQFPDEDPYIDWRETLESEKDTSQLFLTNQKSLLKTRSLVGLGLDNLDGFYIPSIAHNIDFEEYIGRTDNWLPNDEDIPTVDPDTIIVGVIDSGIPLGHNKFRDKDGKTRILAAWQQNANLESNKNDTLAQPYLPFGKELYKSDIDKLIDTHSPTGRKGWLDQDAFDRECETLNILDIQGHRELGGVYSHGAHVLDAAAGEFPDSESEFLRRVKIIVVNFPPRQTFGLAGTYLDPLMEVGLRRIADLSDAIWHKSVGKKQKTPIGVKGFKTVVNISFGKQAGSKDGHDRFTYALNQFNNDRKELDPPWHPTEVVMPVGNDNLLRCHAPIKLAGDADGNASEKSLDWRILPEDHSANFVEIWTESCFHINGEGLQDAGSPIALYLTPPGKEETGPGEVMLNSVTILNDIQGCKPAIAKIYCQVIPSPDITLFRIRFVIGVTSTYNSDGREAPSGVWKIRLKNACGKPIQTFLYVQTDQSILPTGKTGLRSYFDDKDYIVYDDYGRMIDSQSYHDAEMEEDLNTPKRSLVWRHGTINASASHKAVSRVAGYRKSDGRPASYSATGIGEANQSGIALPPDGLRAHHPTAAFPTEDAPAHFGVLASGASNGSVVGMRGTSFASAQATRSVAESYLKDSDDSIQLGKDRLAGKALVDEIADNNRRARGDGGFAHAHKNTMQEKLGSGRAASEMPFKVDRLLGGKLD